MDTFLLILLLFLYHISIFVQYEDLDVSKLFWSMEEIKMLLWWWKDWRPDKAV